MKVHISPENQFILDTNHIYLNIYWYYFSHAISKLLMIFQVRTLFVSGLPMDTKPRELYLLFRAYEVSLSLKLAVRLKFFRISVGYSFMKQTGFRINAVTITANNCIIYYLVNTGGLTFPGLTWPDTCRGTRARCWRWPARTARPPPRWASSPSPAGPAPRRPSRTCR